MNAGTGHEWPVPSPLSIESEPVQQWSRRQKAGTAVRLVRGRYVDTESWSGLSPWQRRRVLLQAWHEHAPETVFSAASALELRGIPVPAGRTVIHTLVPGESRTSRHGVVCGDQRVAHFQLRCQPLRARVVSVERIGRWHLVSVEQAVTDMVGRARTTLPEAVTMLDAAWRALGGGPEAAAKLSAAGKELRAVSARLRVERAMGLASPLAESPAESLARVHIHELGFASPREQLSLTVDGRDYRPDFAWPGRRLILEVDGALKYAGGDETAVRREEKARQLALQRAGWTVARVEWVDVQNPHRLTMILARLGVPPSP